MTIRVITFQEFKNTPQKKWVSAREKGSDALILEDDSENEYLLENVGVESVGSHVAVTVGDERIFVNKYRRTSEWESLFWLLLIPVVLLVASNATEFVKSHYPGRTATDQDVQVRIKELQDMQTSISKMSAYVGSQKKVLEETSQLLDSVKKEKDNVEAALKINREQLDALLATMSKNAERDKWIERVISFITGIISSLIATRIWYARHKEHQRAAEG